MPGCSAPGGHLLPSGPKPGSRTLPSVPGILGISPAGPPDASRGDLPNSTALPGGRFHPGRSEGRSKQAQRHIFAKARGHPLGPVWRPGAPGEAGAALLSSEATPVVRLGRNAASRKLQICTVCTAHHAASRGCGRQGRSGPGEEARGLGNPPGRHQSCQSKQC